MLRLEAKAGALSVDSSTFPDDRPIKKISRVELQPGLGGGDFHGPATGRFDDEGGPFQARTGAIEHPVVVVAGAVLELRVLEPNPITDCLWRSEIERRAFDRCQLTRRN